MSVDPVGEGRVRNEPSSRPGALRIEEPDEATVAALRAMSGAERLRIASGMFRTARRMLESDLAARHPEWDAERVRAEAARRLALGAG